MTYAWPRYLIRVEFGGQEVATAFGQQGLRATVPYLAPELYGIHQSGDRGWRRVGTAARHESGSWTITFDDGREIRGRVGEHPFVV